MGCGEQARSLWDEPPPERNEREQNEVRSFDSSSSGHSRSGSDPHNGRVKRRLRTRGSKSPRKNRDGDGDGDSARANREGPAHRTRTKSVHAPRNARASDATYPCSWSAWRALEPRGCARSGRTDSEVLRVPNPREVLRKSGQDEKRRLSRSSCGGRGYGVRVTHRVTIASHTDTRCAPRPRGGIPLNAVSIARHIVHKQKPSCRPAPTVCAGKCCTARWCFALRSPTRSWQPNSTTTDPRSPLPIGKRDRLVMKK